MDETQTLRNIISTFRVTELQALLAYAQRNRSGNKPDLLKRAMTLIQKPQPSITMKIYEIQRNMKEKTRSTTFVRQDQLINPYSASGNQHHQWGVESMPLMHTNYMGDGRSISLDNKPLLMPSVPVNPDVRFVQLPFYEEMAEILKATSLLTSNNSSRMNFSVFEFHLTPQQVQEIIKNRVGFSNKVTFTIQVHVRFCLMETTCEQTDYYPPHLCIKVNDKLSQTINAIPRPGQPEKKNQHAYPVDLTNLLKLTPAQSNRLTVEWMSDFGKSFVCRIALVRKLTANTLLKRLRSRGLKPADYTRGLIKEKLAAEADDPEISCSSWRVSLTCPLSKCRITEPCRPSGCRHLQCFDASVFLKMNECKPRWQCPICDQPAPYKDLTIDGYFSEILNSRRLTSSNELFIDRDGSWHQNTETVKQEENTHDDEILILDDTDLNIEKDLAGNDVVECIADTPPDMTSADRDSVLTFVDLTASDSEEDDVPLSVLAETIKKTDQHDHSNHQSEPSEIAEQPDASDQPGQSDQTNQLPDNIPQDITNSRTPSTDSEVMVVE